MPASIARAGPPDTGQPPLLWPAVCGSVILNHAPRVMKNLLRPRNHWTQGQYSSIQSLIGGDASLRSA